MPYVPSATLYAQPSDLLKYGMSVAALSSPSTGLAQQNACLLAASSEIDDAIGQRLQLPLIQWGDDIVMHCCWLASWGLIQIRGFDPDNAGDATYKQRWDAAQKWLEAIASGEKSLRAIDSSPNNNLGDSSPNSSPLTYSPAPIYINQTNTRGTGQR